MSGWNTEKLVEVLKESDWWPRYKVQRESAGFNAEKGLSSIVADRAREESFYVEEVRPLRREMLALITEIESGEIYGRVSQCAVCDGRADTFMSGCEHHVYICYKCYETFEHRGAYSAAAVLRARRLLAGSKYTSAIVVPMTCGTCGHPTCSSPRDARSPAFASCWREKTPSTPEKQEKTDPYAAQRQKEERLGFHKMQEGQWGCASAAMTPEAADYYLRGELRRVNKMGEEICRRRVLLGYDRGPDPRLILAGDLWDPKRQR